MSFVDISNKKILDFGCGTGNNCSIFNSSNYLGVDIDKGRIKYAQKLNPKYAFMLVGTKLSEIENSSFDIIFISAVLHHIPNSKIECYLTQFKRILKPNGKLIIYEPYFTPKFIIRNWVMKTFDEGKYIRTENEYLELFEENFNTKVHIRFKIINLYNGIFFSASRKE